MTETASAHFRPRRSVLYVPASNNRAIDRACGLACDAVILDLEDGVAPTAKSRARETAVAALSAGAFGSREVVIRINALGTEWGRDDIAAVRKSQAHALLVPKVDAAADIVTYDRMLQTANASMQLWAMIETARAVLQLGQIAASSQISRLRCLVIGTNDLAGQLRMRLTPRREPLTAMLSLTVAAARAYSLAALDGVYNAYDDTAGFELQCQQGVDYGFDGKTLIHPRQIERCNTWFSPSSDSIGWALKVKSAFDDPLNAGKGALTVDGSMVERLHLAEAERILALDTAIRGSQI